jgi:hypothetical protein
MTNTETKPDRLTPVRHFLSGHKLAFKEREGVLAAAIPLDLGGGDGAREMVIARFRAGGANRGITVRVASQRVLSKANVPRAALAVNQWNAGHLAPRAVIVPRPDGKGSSILLDAWLPASPRVEQKQVDLFLVAVLRGSRAFWKAVDLGGSKDLFG